MKTDAEIVTLFKKHKKASDRGLTKQYKMAKECQNFYVGDFMEYKDTMQFAGQDGQKRRAMVQFNKIKPYVNAVKGFMAQNRCKAKYIARINDDIQQQEFSEYCNSISDYCRDIANADQVETQQDGDMLICGYGPVATAVTYTDGYASADPNGEIIKGRLDPLLTYWDPYAKQSNILDARWVGYQKDYALSDAISLFDDSEEEDFEEAKEDEDQTKGDYEWFARGGRYNKIKEAGVDWADEKNHMVKVFFHEWIEYETYYRANNPAMALKNPMAIQMANSTLDAIALEFRDSEDGKLFNPRAEIISFGPEVKEKLLEHFGEYIQVVPFQRKVFYSAVISGSHVFTKYKSISQRGYSIQFKTGEYDPKNKLWTGMVTSMKEPVQYYNKALTEMMFIIGANSKGGVMYEEGSIIDIQDFEQKYAKTDAAVEVAAGAISGGKIKAKREMFTPSGYENVIQISDAALSDVNGIDRSFLGSSENKQETGILQKRRIKQVVSALACYFDSITLYQKMDARIMIDYMRVFAENNAGGMFRILGENGRNRFLQISIDKLSLDYDVVIQEAAQSPEEKQEQGLFIAAIGDKFMMAQDFQTAKILYSIALKYAELEQQDMQKIMAVLLPNKQEINPQYVQQLEQQVKTLMGEIMTADVEKKKSETAINIAKLDQIAADTHQKLAQSTKAQTEAVQNTIETSLMRKEQPNINTYRGYNGSI